VVDLVEDRRGADGRRRLDGPDADAEVRVAQLRGRPRGPVPLVGAGAELLVGLTVREWERRAELDAGPRARREGRAVVPRELVLDLAVALVAGPGPGHLGLDLDAVDVRDGAGQRDPEVAPLLVLVRGDRRGPDVVARVDVGRRGPGVRTLGVGGAEPAGRDVVEGVRRHGRDAAA